MTASLLLLSLLTPQQAAEAPASALRTEDLRAHITFLASDELEGREGGKRGGHLASKYVAAHFARLGLEFLPGQDDYRLPFQLGELTAYNVVGVIPGTDPQLRDKYLALGAHHDHAGIGGPGAMGFPDQVHNGADDNASGTAGVLELAEYYAAHPLRHSLIVMTFSAEESGLLGSAHLVRSRTVPVDDIVAMFNCDMIGRSVDDYLFVGGLGTAEEFHSFLDPIFERSPLKLELDDRGEAPSDNTSFYNGGIPALFFFTNIHEDYHRPGDDAHLINYEGEQRILELVVDVMRATDGHGNLTFQRSPGMGMPSDFMPRMLDHMRQIEEYKAENRGRLGVKGATMVDDGVLIDEVIAGGAAETAGMQAGDVLQRIDGKRITDARSLRRALSGQRRGLTLEIIVQREGKTLTLEATLQ